jgi:hypothetical protein
MSKFVEVSLANIDEGHFLASAEDAFGQITRDLIRHCEKHGDAAATLAMKVTVKRHEGAYRIITDMDRKLPRQPAKITTALVDLNQTDEPCLFTQAFGTAAGDPRQLRLCGEDGNT